jgi:hypothetical protein
MKADDITPYFTRPDGSYFFARWGRPVVPVVFGVEDASLEVLKGGIEAMIELTGHEMAETDPEIGANLMIFFLRDWGELRDVPNLDRILPGLDGLVVRLEEATANQYRTFRFDETGAIKAAFVFLKVDQALADQPLEEMALVQAVQIMLVWSDTAFAERSPLAVAGERVILRPEIAELTRAAYDPVMPARTEDPTHAVRLSARTGKPQ